MINRILKEMFTTEDGSPPLYIWGILTGFVITYILSLLLK